MWSLLSTLLLTAHARHPAPVLPSWAQTYWTQHTLNTTLRLTAYVKPGILQADFNGDGKTDVAVLVTRKTTGSHGILILHQGLGVHYLVGAGSPQQPDLLHSDYAWATQCQVYTRPTAVEVLFKADGEVLGDRTIRLHRPAITVWTDEEGGGLIYWDGKRYRWIHQSC